MYSSSICIILLLYTSVHVYGYKAKSRFEADIDAVAYNPIIVQHYKDISGSNIDTLPYIYPGHGHDHDDPSINTLCGTDILNADNIPIILTSPLYPSTTTTSISCTWYIISPDDTNLSIRFIDLDLEEDDRCDSTFQTCCSHNWISVNSDRYCGRNRTHTNLSFLKPNSTLKFHSSKVYNKGRGFKLIYLACKRNQFKCNDTTECIDISERCDGVPRCKDGSDEWDCGPFNGKFRKNLAQIILDDGGECNGDNMISCGDSDRGCYDNSTMRCNDKADCTISGADEIDCGVCGPDKLYCRSGGCYPNWGACDGINHCAGGWDEGELGGCGACNFGLVPCGSRDVCHCYHAREQRCDMRVDCPNGEDEMSCVPGCEDKIACASVQGCYLPSERCDGIAQCLDKSDESDCVRLPSLEKFKCVSSSTCIDESFVCNGEDDCGDASDEADCVRNSVITVVVMGTLTCGMLAVMGIAFGWRYYVAKIRATAIEARNAYQRQIDQGPLDEDSLYHLYREPPPSYHEAVLQGASPPVYCHPTRYVNLSNRSEDSTPATTPRRIRPRGAIRRGLRQVPKPIELTKPVEDSPLTLTNVVASAVLAGDQLYPESGTSRDVDAPMLELSDNTTNNQDNCSDLESISSTGATCGSILISIESPNHH